VFEAELIAKIRQLFYAEHWRIGTIAAELGVHPDGVRRAIGSSAFHRSPTARRQSQCAPYLAFITEILRKYPRLRATRIYEMVRRRGYPGSVVGLRRAVRTLRPTVVAEVYQRLDLLAGDQAQVDWASFGKLAVGRAERRLMCFVMVLSYSRALYIEFALDETLESFLRAHRRAFEWFGGSTRIVLHDNTKSAVIARLSVSTHSDGPPVTQIDGPGGGRFRTRLNGIVC
jgi:transposase